MPQKGTPQNQQKRSAQLKLTQLLQTSWKTPHHRIVTCGLLVGFCYLPFWLTDIVVGTLHGAASLMMVAAIGLGLYLLWNDRSRLAKLQADLEDRWLGHGMILTGVGLAPFCAVSEWSQKLVWIFILIGIGLSIWGIRLLQQYPLSIALILLGFFPQPTVVAKAVWVAFMPPQILERCMAWAGASGLSLIGQSAQLDGTLIALPGGVVEVAWGCSGFDMATIMAAASLLLGILLKQERAKIALMISIGIVLAFLFNIPRIMLMAVAAAYWGKAAFAFWHGFWGGQIFSTLLFTIYYYAVMGIMNRKSAKFISSK